MKRRLLNIGLTVGLLVGGCFWTTRPSEQEQIVVAAARACLGDIYETQSFPEGAPPEGRGACTDVVWRALAPLMDVQERVDQDIAANPDIYPGQRNRDLDFRWCPKLMLWASRQSEDLPRELSWVTVWTFRPGDLVFYDTGDGVPGHVGVVSDRWSWTGQPLLIHNFGPVCVEENALGMGKILGHYRLVKP